MVIRGFISWITLQAIAGQWQRNRNPHWNRSHHWKVQFIVLIFTNFFLNLVSQKFPILELLSWQRYVGNSIPGLFRRSCRLCCKVLHNLNVHDHLRDYENMTSKKVLLQEVRSRCRDCGKSMTAPRSNLRHLFSIHPHHNCCYGDLLLNNVVYYIYRVAV